MSSHSETAGETNRKDRRRLETRGKLIDAALRVIGRKGFAATTIADITGEADVGLGTFYHHFDSKDVLLDPVLGQVAERLGAAIDAASAHMTDPAEVIATAVRCMVRQADEDSAAGWFVVRILSLPDTPDAFLRRNMRDLQRGVDSGRFHLDDLATAQAMICGAVTWTIQARLTGRAPNDADVQLARMLLRSLGVPDTEAAVIARRPMPAIAPPPPKPANEFNQRR